MRPFADIAAAVDRRIARVGRTKSVVARNTAPIASITFDDFPASAARAGADSLEARGVRGSFYVSGGLEGRMWDNGPQFSRDDLERLSERGHEIGCHTFEHLDCFRSTANDLKASLDRNQAYVRDVLGDTTPSTFSYPYGYYSTAAKFRLQRRFAACRSIIPGVNAGTIDLGLLKSVVIPRGSVDAAWITPWLDRTRASTGWLILCAHDVRVDHGPFGCTPDGLAAAIDSILAAGIEILPVKDALGRIAPDAT